VIRHVVRGILSSDGRPAALDSTELHAARAKLVNPRLVLIPLAVFREWGNAS